MVIKHKVCVFAELQVSGVTLARVAWAAGTFSMKPTGPAHTRAATAEPIKPERSCSPTPEFIHGGDTKHQPGGESAASHKAVRMVYSTSGYAKSTDRTEQEQRTVAQMIGKYFSQMTSSSRRGSVESYDERDPSHSGKNILISQFLVQ